MKNREFIKQLRRNEMFLPGKDTMYSCSKHNYTGLNNSCPDCKKELKEFAWEWYQKAHWGKSPKNILDVQVIEETRDKKPRRKDFVNAAEYYIATIDWYESFSTWLSAQLEKAEKENREIKDLIIAGNWERLCDLYNNFNQE